MRLRSFFSANAAALAASLLLSGCGTHSSSGLDRASFLQRYANHPADPKGICQMRAISAYNDAQEHNTKVLLGYGAAGGAGGGIIGSSVTAVPPSSRWVEQLWGQLLD